MPGILQQSLSVGAQRNKWRIFQRMSTKGFIEIMQPLARTFDLAKFRKHKRGPKKPRQKRTQISKQPHVSTARLIKG
jgi:hypothetical protein